MNKIIQEEKSRSAVIVWLFASIFLFVVVSLCYAEPIQETKYAGMVNEVKELTGLRPDTTGLEIEFLKDVKAVKKLSKSGGVSFYSVKENKIYTYIGVPRKVIYHEIAHALMQLYFNRNIPSGIVEIIPQWVEKQLRKTE